MQDQRAYRVQGDEHEGHGASQYNTPQGGQGGYGRRGGYEGRGGYRGYRGWGQGRGRGQIVCYNYNQPGHLTRDCQNSTTTCKYCHVTDHVIEECPQLMAKM